MHVFLLSANTYCNIIVMLFTKHRCRLLIRNTHRLTHSLSVERQSIRWREQNDGDNEWV